MDLANRYGLRVSALSKAGRGYALICDLPPVYKAASPPRLDAFADTEGAVRRLIGNGADHLREAVAAMESAQNSHSLGLLRLGLRDLSGAIAASRKLLGPLGADLNRNVERGLRTAELARDLERFVAKGLPANLNDALGPTLQAAFACHAKARSAEANDRCLRMMRRCSFTRLLMTTSWIFAGGGPALAPTVPSERPQNRPEMDGRHARRLSPAAGGGPPPFRSAGSVARYSSESRALCLPE